MHSIENPWIVTIRWYEQTAPDRKAYQEASDAYQDLHALPFDRWKQTDETFCALIAKLPALGSLDKLLTSVTTWIGEDQIPADGITALCSLVEHMTTRDCRPQGRVLCDLLERLEEKITQPDAPKTLRTAASAMTAHILSDRAQHLIGFPNSNVYLPDATRETLLKEAQQNMFESVCSGMLPYLAGNDAYIADCDIGECYRIMQDMGEQCSNDNQPIPSDVQSTYDVFTRFSQRHPPAFTWSERRILKEFLTRHQ